MPQTLTIALERRHRRQKTTTSARQRLQRGILGFAFLVSAVLIILVIGAGLAYAGLTRGLPPIQKMTVLLNPRDGLLLQPTRLYDKSGTHLLAVLSPTGEDRTYIPYSQFPRTLVDATIAMEEPNFWVSPGYTLAGWRDPSSHPTLAQQLAEEYLLPDASPNPTRAIHERMLAAQMTSFYGREQVLEWYLNSANYGHYAFGAEEAAELYLGKSVTQLNLGEAALIAAIGHAPALNPFDEPKTFESRRIWVITTMMGMQLITPAQASQAILNLPKLAKPPGGTQSGVEPIAPAFTRTVLAELGSLYGEERVARGGLSVLTSLDYDLQVQSVCLLQAGVEESSCETARLLSTTAGSDTTASLLLLDPASGQVLAEVGDMAHGVQGDTLSAHAAGTSITPFIYLTAFSKGFNPASLAWDIPAGATDPGQVYHGPIRLRVALANDLLEPARSLLQQLSQESVRNTASSFGLQLPAGLRLLQEDFPLSPLDLAQAYAVLANAGIQAGQATNGNDLAPVSVLKVSGADHSIWLDRSSPLERSVASPQLAYLLNQVLGDETARWVSPSSRQLEIGRPAAAKVSTSLDLSGAWTIGYTPRLLAVVWTGGESGSDSASLADYSAALWHALMQYSLRNAPLYSWEEPQGLVTVPVCDPSGMLPTPQCPNVVNEIFLEGRQPVQADTLYRSIKVNTETGLLATVFTPPELVEARTYMDVPERALTWAREHNIQPPPTAYDTVEQPPMLPDAHITAPALFADGRGVIQVLGSAEGADFRSYRLEYGQGLYPPAWYQVGTDSTLPVSEGLLGQWDTSGLNGLYALRLMVVRADARVDQAVIQVTLDNTPPQLAITYPLDGQVLSPAEEPQVALQAQVNEPFLARVEFYVDGTLVGSSAEIPLGVLWTAHKGEHMLKVVAFDRAGNSAEAIVKFSVK